MAEAPTIWKPVPYQKEAEVAPNNAGVIRVTQAGATRVLQDGVTTRVLNDDVTTPEAATVWAENDGT